jgi:hypothetical protein
MAARSLDDLQRWMLAAVMDPTYAADGEIQAAILPSRQQSAGERLAVYQNAYFARLLEVLREQFPCTRFAAGEKVFDQLALGYLQMHPPHSYTLAHLADHLSEHLDATRPADWGEFLVELVRLEHAIDRVFDGPGSEGTAPFAFPADASESLRLSFVPGFELHAFRYPVSAYYTAWKAGSEPGWPESREQFVALLRRDYIVRRHELSSAQHRLLQCLQAGTTLGEALASIADSSEGESLDVLASSVRDWFIQWTASDFFAAASGSNCPSVP